MTTRRKTSLVHSGQVALVMVLIMTVLSVVVVSLASRSTVETRVQEMGVESTGALLAAQAGLEQAVMTESAVSGTLDNDHSYDVSVDAEGVSGITTDRINPGEVVEVNLIGAVSITGVKVYWKPISSGANPAVFVSDVRTDRTLDYAYAPSNADGFTQVSSGGSFNGVNYDFVTPSPIAVSLANSRTLRIVVLGSPALIGVQPVGGQFSPQIKHYRSVGNVGSGASNVKYGIEYEESATNQLPTIFEYALFSGGTIVQ